MRTSITIVVAACIAAGCAGKWTGGGSHAGSGARDHGGLPISTSITKGPTLPGDTFSEVTGIAAVIAGGKPNRAGLNQDRRDATATTLRDGRVMIIGGRRGGSALNSAEMYNQSTAEFVLVKKTMNGARSGHSATLLQDGKILVMGGLDDNATPTDSAEIFDPLTEEFTTISPLPSKRAGHAAILLSSGEVLVCGGAVRQIQVRRGNTIVQGWEVTAEVAIFSQSTQAGKHFNSRLVPASMNDGRAYSQGYLLPPGPSGTDRVVVFGGVRGLPNQPATGVLQNAEVYDVGLNTWTKVNIPNLQPRWGGYAVPVNFRKAPGGTSKKFGGGNNLWDILLVGGLTVSDLGNQLTSLQMGDSMRDDGAGPQVAAELVRIENTQIPTGTMLAQGDMTKANGLQPGQIPPIGAGMAVALISRREAGKDRVITAGGNFFDSQSQSRIYTDLGVLITIDGSGATPTLTLDLAGQGAGSVPSPNKFKSAAKLSYAKSFSKAALMAGADGQFGTGDDTVLFPGGEIQGPAETFSSDVYAPIPK